MKPLYIFIMSLLISHSVYANDTAINFREYYYGVCLNEMSIKDFDSYLNLHEGSNDVLIKGYQAVIWFLWADYYVNPLQKWKCFNLGKKKLETLINNNENNIELKFLRLTIQENLPSFLGYDNNKKEDRDFIYKNMNKVTDEDLHTKIANYLCYNGMTKID